MTKRNPWRKLLNKVKLSASPQASRSRTKKVEITEEDLQDQWKKQNGKCFWLGLDILIEDVYTSNNPFAPSVDRLDNDKDYTKDNIVICTTFANLGRGRVKKEEFTLFIQFLKDHINDK